MKLRVIVINLPTKGILNGKKKLFKFFDTSKLQVLKKVFKVFLEKKRRL